MVAFGHQRERVESEWAGVLQSLEREHEEVCRLLRGGGESKGGAKGDGGNGGAEQPEEAKANGGARK